MKQRIFVTATGTGVGKSFITAALVRQARARGHSVTAFKPIISGFDPAADSDTGLLLRALGEPVTPDSIASISPWCFAAPLAPSMAARQENKPIDFGALVAFCRGAIDGPEENLFIEGVGGVMVPLTDEHTVLDWIAALDIPVLLVTGTYLGALSHALTTLTVLQQRKIPLYAVIVNESEESSVSLADTVGELKRWTKARVIAVKRGAQTIEELD